MVMGMTAALIGAPAKDLLIASMSLLVDGNLFFDNFTRPNVQPLGNDWIEVPPGLGFQVNDFLVETNPGQPGMAYHTHSILPSGDLMIQANLQMREGPGNDFGFLRGRNDDGGTAGVGVSWNGFFNLYTIDFNPGSSKLFAQPIIDNDKATLRLVIEDSGSFTFGRLYHFFSPIMSMSAMENDLTLVGEHSASTILRTSSSYIELSPQLPNRLDQFFVCGKDVIVTGLSGRHKIRILGPAATQSFVEQSNGTASINVNTYAMPMTTLEIADRFGTTLSLTTPTKGLWGGDEYSASVIE